MLRAALAWACLAVVARGRGAETQPPGAALPEPSPAVLANSYREELLADAKAPTQFVDVIPAVEVRMIDLPTALALAQRINPEIRIARVAIQRALALNLQAQLLAVPNLNAGTNYHRHMGPLQTSFGEIRSLQEQSLYVGGGARTLAAETVAIPMVQFLTHLGDAWYAPLAARQVVAARRADSLAIQNSMSLEVVRRYLELVRAETQLEAIRQSEREAGDLVRSTAAFAATGQGREGDYRRAKADALLLRMDEQRLQEAVGVASAELAHLLRIDPSIRLSTVAAPAGLIQLIDPNASLDQLVETAISQRPELAARTSEIGAAAVRVRQEQTRPLFPLLAVGFSAGGFGGGSNRSDLGVSSLFQRFGTRTDFDVLALWQFQNFGVGNLALTRGRAAEQNQAYQLRMLTRNDIGQQVSTAYARVKAQLLKVQVAARQLPLALQGVREEIRRTRAGEGLPIEALNSVHLLKVSRQELVDAVIDYDEAQFELFVAIGQIATPFLPDPSMPPRPRS